MVLTEKRGTGFHVVSEANGKRSRDAITILSGEVLEVGAVIGKITASGKYIETDPDAVDGSEVAAGVLYAAVDATDGDVAGVAHLRDCEVYKAELNYISTADAGEILTMDAELLAVGIVART